MIHHKQAASICEKVSSTNVNAYTSKRIVDKKDIDQFSLIWFCKKCFTMVPDKQEVWDQYRYSENMAESPKGKSKGIGHTHGESHHDRYTKVSKDRL